MSDIALNCGQSPCSSVRPEKPLDEALRQRVATHPCYSKDAHFQFARMHLPVAPACNVQCNYCNRKYDCANESRPGVSSELLTPQEALIKTKLVKKNIPNLTVAGIAGPGDPMANPDKTLETFRLIGKEFPELKLCLSSNGLAVPEYLDDIAKLNIEHVTLTINFIDPEVGAKIYKWVRFQGKTYTGVEGAQILHRRQVEALDGLLSRNVLTKINMVLVPGINDHHLPEVARFVTERGAFLVNVLPFIPSAGANFEHIRRPTVQELNDVRAQFPEEVRLMTHCNQCRADAIGLLGQDRSQEFTKAKLQDRYFKVAVASKDGTAVDVHFGHARSFRIYEFVDGEVQFLEERIVPQYCHGKEGCGDKESVLEAVRRTVEDCRGILVSRVGYGPALELSELGVNVYRAVGPLEDAINAFAQGKWPLAAG